MTPWRPIARAVAGVAAVLLTSYLALIAWSVFPYQLTADFHQFWGVGAARAAESLPGTPYIERAAYGAALARLAASGSSEKLQAAHAQRPELDPTGTPLFYAVFALLPRDYDLAQAIFVLLNYACAYGGVFALARLRGFGVAAAACLAAGVSLTFGPVVVDARVGNVNSIQLACIAAVIAASMRGQQDVERDHWIVGVLVAFVAFKPNTALIAAAVALRHRIVWRQGAVVLAACFAGASLIAGSWYFGLPSAWFEWAGYARRLGGVDPSLVYESGNQSLAMWFARRTGSGNPAAFGLALGFTLVLAVVAVAAGRTRDPARAVAVLRAAFHDPFFAVSFAILLTFAVSPLVWIHYLVFALVPMLWLLHGHGKVATIGAIAAYSAVATPVLSFLLESGARGLVEPVTLLSWLALVPGMLSFVARVSRDMASQRPADF